MSKQLRTEIDIDATPQRVWEILTDFAAYPDWNPFITRVQGTPATGTKLEVRLQPVGGRGITMRPQVLDAEPGKRLRWLGHLLVKGVFDGEHSFTIERRGDAQIRFGQHEEFRGVLVPFFARSLDRHTLPGFEQMNLALKRRAEAPQS